MISGVEWPRSDCIVPSGVPTESRIVAWLQVLTTGRNDRAITPLETSSESTPHVLRFGQCTLQIVPPRSLAVASDDLKQKFGGIEGLPTTMLYDRQGILRKKVIGFEYTDEIESALKSVL